MKAMAWGRWWTSPLFTGLPLPIATPASPGAAAAAGADFVATVVNPEAGSPAETTWRHLVNAAGLAVPELAVVHAIHGRFVTPPQVHPSRPLAHHGGRER